MEKHLQYHYILLLIIVFSLFSLVLGWLPYDVVTFPFIFYRY